MIPVGLIPVRTPDSLSLALDKTINSKPTASLAFIHSKDWWSSNTSKYVEKVKSLAGLLISVSQIVFDEASPSEEVYQA